MICEVIVIKDCKIKDFKNRRVIRNYKNFKYIYFFYFGVSNDCFIYYIVNIIKLLVFVSLIFIYILKLKIK